MKKVMFILSACHKVMTRLFNFLHCNVEGSMVLLSVLPQYMTSGLEIVLGLINCNQRNMELPLRGPPLLQEEMTAVISL